MESKVVQQGFQRIVTACPACHYRLEKIFPELQVISIYQLLVDERRKVSGLFTRIAVHDSCPDRFTQMMGSAVRALLPETQELKHKGKRSLCCGAGNGVNFVDAELASEIGHSRWSEVEASSAQLLVTYCMNCAVQLAQTSSNVPVVHILEWYLIWNGITTGLQPMPTTSHNLSLQWIKTRKQTNHQMERRPNLFSSDIP